MLDEPKMKKSYIVRLFNIMLKDYSKITRSVQGKTRAPNCPDFSDLS